MPGRPEGLSLVIPVYRNEASLDRLLPELERLRTACPVPLEVVFVVDGSPDRCLELLRERLPRAGFAARLVSLSRNFGSFNAIRAVLPHMRAQRRGHIVNVASVVGKLAFPFHGAYSATKFGVMVSRMRLPSGSSFGKWRRAKESLMSMTFAASAASRSVSARPRSSGIPIAFK